MPSHSTHIHHHMCPACMGLVTLKIPNFAILIRVAWLTPIDQQERKTHDFDGDETKTGSARLVVYVGAM